MRRKDWPPQRRTQDAERTTHDASRSELAAALATLPADQREVVLMRFLDDMSLAKPRRLILPIRWAGVAAAAALVALGVFLYTGPDSNNHPSSIRSGAAA
ncbi:MAG TPA: sigma factor-like helix-turn-helix DNA-binding protein [Sedimentisphaerales bacterium]|nr:sigma factor-like helix-turn-helix DNA-binding protein [Sedimentisphaerales bacterium]